MKIARAKAKPHPEDAMFHTLNIGDSLSTSNGGTFTLRDVDPDALTAVVNLKLHRPEPAVAGAKRIITVLSHQTLQPCPDCKQLVWVDEGKNACSSCRCSA